MNFFYSFKTLFLPYLNIILFSVYFPCKSPVIKSYSLINVPDFFPLKKGFQNFYSVPNNALLLNRWVSYSSRLFPGRSWFYGLKFLRLVVSQNSVRGVKCPWFFQILNNTSFLTIWIFWLSDCGRKYVSERRKPATNRKESERERRMCRLIVIECGLRLWRMRNGCEKKNQWTEFYFIVIIIIIISFFIRME